MSGSLRPRLNHDTHRAAQVIESFCPNYIPNQIVVGLNLFVELMVAEIERGDQMAKRSCLHFALKDSRHDDHSLEL